MPERVTQISLLAKVGSYIADMKKASRATQDSTAESEAALKRQHDAMSEVGAQATVMGGLILAGVGVAVAKFAEFDKAMSEVQASTHESADNMAILRDAALDAGAKTAFSATEAANAIDELAKAGISTADITGGALAGSLDLAAAGGLGVANAAEIAATAMTQFNKKGSEVPHIADLLAAGAGKAQGSVEDLAAALNQGGLVASQAGFSIEETTGTLAAFASAGLLGSDAGTSLKTAILALQNPSAKAKGLMEDYGISVYDAQGSMLGMSEIAGQLEAAFIGKTDAERDSTLATIFGSDAVRAASVLYSQGADGIQEWIDKTNDAGYAAITAAIKLDNLAGDFEYLQGSIDTALIQGGSGANEVLREMTQRATDLVDWFGALPAPILSTGLAIATTVGGFTLLGGVLLVGATRVGDMRRNLITLNEEMPKTAKFAAGAAKGLGLISGLLTAATVLDAIAQSGNRAAPTLEQTARAMKEFDGLDKVFADLDGAGQVEDLSSALSLLTSGDATSSINRWASSINQAMGGQFSDSVQTTREQFEKVDQALTALVEGGAADEAARQFEVVAKAAEAQGIPTEKLMKEILPGYQEALIGASEAQEGGAASAEKNAKQLEVLSGKAQSAEVDIEDLAEAIRGFGSAQLNVNSATREFEESIDALTESVIANGVSLDVAEEQGRSNQAALDAIAQSALGAAAAILEQTGSQEDATAAVARGREELILALAQFGITGTAAEDYADDLGLIPANVTTAVGLTGVPEAQAAIDSFIDRNTGATIYMTASVQTKFDSAFAQPGAGLSSAGGGVLKKRADGGTIWGPGTAWSDTAGIYALSTGEEVVSNKYGQADTHRSTLKAINGGASVEELRSMLSGAFADGGTAGRGSAYDPTAYAGAYASQGRSYLPGSGGGWGGGGMSTSTTTLTTVINPQPRQSEREIGQAAADWQTARLRGM